MSCTGTSCLISSDDVCSQPEVICAMHFARCVIMFSCISFVRGEFSYVGLIACVYKTSGVLIFASHLPNISTLSVPCVPVCSLTCTGFSTRPAVHSQPQIRAVYLTTVASSSAYTLRLFLSASLSLLSRHVDATPWVACWAVSPQVVC